MVKDPRAEHYVANVLMELCLLDVKVPFGCLVLKRAELLSVYLLTE